MKQKFLRLFAVLAIAGLILVFPAVTDTENEAEAWMCTGTWQHLHSLQVQGPCAETGEPIQCNLMMSPSCEQTVVCNC